MWQIDMVSLISKLFNILDENDNFANIHSNVSHAANYPDALTNKLNRFLLDRGGVEVLPASTTT